MNNKGIKKITFSVIVFTFALLLFFNTSEVKGSDKVSASKPQYKIVVIEKGDTLWNIVKDNCNNYGDIRKAIQDLKTYNNITSSALFPGQEIKIPLKFCK